MTEYETLCALSATCETMLQAAQSEDWERVRQLDDERGTLLDRLDAQAIDASQAHLAPLRQRILQMDAAIVNYVTGAMTRMREEYVGNQRNREGLRAYSATLR
ncbi:MAG: flagellar protein FliT [Thiotrichales bacterium]